MKTILRKKCNNLLQRFIRLFSLTSVAFVVTACYGTPHVEYEVEGQIYGEDNEPLKSMQVVVRTFNDYSYAWPDTVQNYKCGSYRATYGISALGVVAV